jgi:hypothetical protein
MRYNKVRAVNEYQKQFDQFLKIFVRLCIVIWVLGLLKFIPDSLANKIVDKLLGMIGLA